MKIRIEGTREEVEEAIGKIKEVYGEAVLSVSSFRPWMRKDKSSKIGAVYIDIGTDGK